MSNKNLSDQDKLTLGLILSFIKNDKECFMGNEYIAEKMGITKNAASIRIKRLEKLGCISLRYTYKEGKMEVDKRYVKLLSLTPNVSSETQEVSSHRQGVSSETQEVSSHRQGVSSDRQEGIVPQTMGYRPADEGVSCKPGGIRQDLLDNVLDNVLDKKLNKTNKLTKFEIEQIKINLNSWGLPQELQNAIQQSIEGFLTNKQKELIKSNKTKLEHIGILQRVFDEVGI